MVMIPIHREPKLQVVADYKRGFPVCVNGVRTTISELIMLAGDRKCSAPST